MFLVVVFAISNERKVLLPCASFDYGKTHCIQYFLYHVPESEVLPHRKPASTGISSETTAVLGDTTKWTHCIFLSKPLAGIISAFLRLIAFTIDYLATASKLTEHSDKSILSRKTRVRISKWR